MLAFPRRRSFAPARAPSRARCLRPIAATEDEYRDLEPFGSSHSVASGGEFWREPIGDCNVCAIPIVREVVPMAWTWVQIRPLRRTIVVIGGWSGHGIALGVRVGQLIADALVARAPLPAWGAVPDASAD